MALHFIENLEWRGRAEEYLRKCTESILEEASQ